MKTPQFKFIAALIAIALIFAGATSGCKTTPQRATYVSVGATAITVEAAIHAYDVFAAQGKTTVAQNQQVKAAFLKYQAAFAVVCDAGAIYASTSGTNAPAASLALNQAIANSGQTLADLINLIRSFGVKI